VGCATSVYRQILTYDFDIRLDLLLARVLCYPAAYTVNSLGFTLRCRVNFNQGVVKVVATTLFIFFGVETLGRKVSLFISAMGMGTLFYIIGAILKTHPPSVNPNLADASPLPASQAMAAMLYIYVCFYSMGWGNETSFNIDKSRIGLLFSL
jgi:hypothetical protein